MEVELNNSTADSFSVLMIFFSLSACIDLRTLNYIISINSGGFIISINIGHCFAGQFKRSNLLCYMEDAQKLRFLFKPCQ